MVAASDQYGAMGNDLIDAHLAHLRALGQSARTIVARDNILRRLHNHLPYGIVWADTDEIQAWLAGFAGWTRYTYDGHTRSFFRWADGHRLDGNPMLDLPRPAHPDLLPNPVTDAELHTALAQSDEWWRTVILLACQEGLRSSEIAGLCREDITAERVLIRRGKGGRSGSVPTHRQIWGRLANYPPGPIVCGRDDGPITGRCLSARARGHFDAIGLPAVHLHRFRHWHATEQLRRGVDLRTVQENMRHRSVTSTQGYTLIVDAQRQAAIDALPDLLTEHEPV